MAKRPHDGLFDPAKRIRLSYPDLDDPIPSTSAELNEDEILMLASQAMENVERVNTFKNDSSASSKQQNRYNTRNAFNSSSNTRSNKDSKNGPTSDHFLEHLREIQEENKKYQVQQSELAENNMVKNGEIAILRAQLKSCKVEITNAKTENMKNNEKNQMEFTDKLKRLEAEMLKQKSELDLKKMEIAQLKEKCRTLESSRIKLIEPSPIADNFKRMSQQVTSFFGNKPDYSHSKKVKSKETSVQTWSKINVKLHPIKRPDYPLKTAIDNCIFNCTKLENPIVFSSNESTQLVGHFNFLLMREKILSNLNGSSKTVRKKSVEYNLKLDHIYGDLSSLIYTSSGELGDAKSVLHGLKIALFCKEFLLKSLDQFQILSNKISMRVLKEMDIKYLESSEMGCDLLTEKKYFDESAWFKDEQCIDSRRILAVLGVLCQHIKPLASYVLGLENLELSKSNSIVEFQKSLHYLSKHCKNTTEESTFPSIFSKIFKLILKIRCSHLLTGLLSSICFLMASALSSCTESFDNDIICCVTKEMLTLRPHITVIESMMKMLVSVENKNFLESLCNNTDKGNLKYDFAEGVAVYNEDTCSLQILCNILETWSTHFVSTNHISSLVSITDNLLKFNQHGDSSDDNLRCKCLCSTRMTRCIWVYLQRCASLCDQHFNQIKDLNVLKQLSSTLRAGIMLLHFCILKDMEFLSRLKDYEGHCQIFVSICSNIADKLQLHVVHKEALAGAKNSMAFVLGNDEEPLVKNIWEHCFDQFSITD